MAKCDDIPIDQLVRGWLTLMEVEAVNELSDARQFARINNSAYTINRVKYATYQLATVRKIRSRIPRSWRKAFVTEASCEVS